MPTVTYKCGKTGKTKKKTFAYNAIGKAQSTEFAKLMGGSKKNNPGPGEEVMSTKDKQPTMTKQKFMEQSRKSVEDFKAQNKGLKNVGKRRRATKGLKELQKTVAKGGAKGAPKPPSKQVKSTAYKKAKAKTNKKFTKIQKGAAKGLKKADNKARADYRKAERKKRGGDMRPLIGSGRVKRAKKVIKRNKALKRK